MSININMLYYPTETVSFMVILSRRVNPFSHFHADFSMALSCEEVETGSARLYACSIFTFFRALIGNSLQHAQPRSFKCSDCQQNKDSR